MITFHRMAEGRLHRVDAAPLPAATDVVWLDLCDPSPEDARAVETVLGLEVPTRQEMAEIEESARLYAEGDALVMTAAVVDGAGDGRPRRAEVTFLLSRDHLVTVRYANPMPFRTFEARVAKSPVENTSAPALFVSLMESFVERIADVMESVAADLNGVSDTVFYNLAPTGHGKGQGKGKAGGEPRTDLQDLIKVLGRKNRVLSILRESLMNFGRIIPFLKQGAADWMRNGPAARLKAVDRDIKSLAAYEAQLEQQISFLHEAVLGLINIEQNAIIKVFSIAAVLFLPPTLVGTVYGMNFAAMPELTWTFGYPFALATMILSALVPYQWFKRRGWL